MRARAALLALILTSSAAAAVGQTVPAPVPLEPAAGQPASEAGPAPPVSPSSGPAPAAATETVPTAGIRTGNHPGYGRVVFDLPPGATWTVNRVGDRITVRFAGAEPVAGARPPHNVRTLTAEAGTAELLLAPGVKLRQVRLSDRLVLDLLDPVPAAAAPGTDSATEPAAQQAAPPLPVPPPRPAGRPAVPAAKPWAGAGRPAALPAPPPAPPPALAAATAPTSLLPQAGGAPAAPPPAQVAAAAGPATKPAAAAGPPPAPPATSRGAPTPPAAPPPVSPAPPPPVTAAPGPPAAPSPPPPVADAARPGPVALAAAPAAAGAAILLPFAAGTGAAAFRRGDDVVLVFDERRPIDAEPLHNDRVFGSAEIRLLPEATMLRLPLPAGRAVRLSRGQGGWTIAVGDEPALRPIRPALDMTADGPRLRLPAEQPGRSVAVPDPLTGGTLLVGTQRASGQGIVMARRTPEFSLLPTWQGVAVAIASDALVLREAPDGFTLASAVPHSGLMVDRPDTDLAALDDATRLTRRFDFPALPVPALLRRLQGAVAGAGAAPAGMRTAPRIETAQAMLALGLGAEAQAVLALAATNDPRAADNPDLIGLSAIAALLAGRPDESAALEDPRLTGTDEVALWRGLRAATLREGAPDAATVLAAELRLLLAYPAPLQSRLLPLAAETMALGGEAEAAQHLADLRAGDASLDYARAVLAENRDRHAALAILDRLAQSADRRERARAAQRAVELRLAAGEITPQQAADAMERLLYAWRGDGREVALRLRAAELRALAGAPRAALTLLREAVDALPEAKDTLRTRMESTFAAALTADGRTPMPPLELVAMAEENPDLIGEGEAGLALAGKLADRLGALDLPRRAAPVLEKLVAAAQPGVVRAELGGRLAANRLLLGDPAGALSALGATAADNLPPPVLEARVLVWARASAAQGDSTRAAAALEALDTPAAMELRSLLLEQAKDWKGADAALRSLTARTVPADGALTEAQAATLLRLAAAAAQAGDEAMLTQLRDRDLARLPKGQTADMLRLLTETPVKNPEDLPRARREAALAGGLLGAGAR